jgi:hypothetical protein
MASSQLIRIIVVLGGIGVCSSQEAPPQRVNLGRLSIASVFSTQMEPDDPVCDIRNLFDGASQSSCPVAGNSVEVRFKRISTCPWSKSPEFESRTICPGG